MGNVILYEKNNRGHRQTYADICQNLLGADPLFGSMRSHFFKLFKAKKLICSSCDSYFLKFITLSILRAAVKRHTIGIMIRPEKYVNQNDWRYLATFVLLHITLRIPHTKTISILPFNVEPKLSTLVDDWIFDPQFWDLSYLGLDPRIVDPPPELLNLKQKAAGRLIIASLGKQDTLKGSDYFCQIYIANPELARDALFIMVGDCSCLDTVTVKAFCKAGGVVINRFVSDEELLATYRIVDVIWTCYSLNYNQSSGIFGRAVQTGKPMIVRTDSYLQKLQNQFHFYDGNALTLSCSNIHRDSIAIKEIINRLHQVPLPVRQLPDVLGVERFQTIFEKYLQLNPFSYKKHDR